MHRFYVPSSAVSGAMVSLPPDSAAQVRRVLRMRTGDELQVFDGTGAEWTAHIVQIAASGVTAEVTGVAWPSVEPGVAVTVAQSIVKPDRFEMVLQKCTEIGAAGFVPVLSERVISADGAAPSPARAERWRRIIQEAAEQSGRVRLPVLSTVTRFEEALSKATCAGPVVFLWETGERPGVRQVLQAVCEKSAPRALSLFIGPVGGYSEREAALASKAGARAAGLGPRVLRSETAAVAALSAVMYELGQMGG